MNKKQQRQQKMLRQQEIVNAARDAGRDLTAEEQTEFESLQREIERLNGEIEAEEQQQRGMNPQPNAPPQNPANPEAEIQTRKRTKPVNTVMLWMTDITKNLIGIIFFSLLL